MEKIIVKSDGSSKFVSGEWMGAYGFVIKRNGYTVKKKSGFLGSKGIRNGGTEAEVQAALKALKYIQENHSDKKVIIKTDSPTVKKKLDSNPLVDQTAKEVEIWQVDRNTVAEAHYVCDRVWERPHRVERKLTLGR